MVSTVVDATVAGSSVTSATIEPADSSTVADEALRQPADAVPRSPTTAALKSDTEELLAASSASRSPVKVTLTARGREVSAGTAQHVTPSPVNPESEQAQENEPAVSVQVAFGWQLSLLVLHSWTFWHELGSPEPVQPGLQVQVNEPCVFSHTAWPINVSHGGNSAAHSSTSSHLVPALSASARLGSEKPGLHSQLAPTAESHVVTSLQQCESGLQPKLAMQVVGETVGETVGVEVLGATVGELVGTDVGAAENGEPVGDTLGYQVGSLLGDVVGENDGVGLAVGTTVGDEVGSDWVGCQLGNVVGVVLGEWVGTAEGVQLGKAVGGRLGESDGTLVGSRVGALVGSPVGADVVGWLVGDAVGADDVGAAVG